MERTDYLIVEDEAITADMLEILISRLRPDWKCIGKTSSVKETVEFLRKSQPELIFMDIDLSDSVCFEIFRQVRTDAPVIFTTAYNQYAVEAFKANGIGYILKPVKEEELEEAIRKFESIRSRTAAPDYSMLEKMIRKIHSRSRIMVEAGNSYIYVDYADIAGFSSEEKLTSLHTFSGQSYVIDRPLDSLEQDLDSEMFYRVSRSSIVNIKAVNNIRKTLRGRLIITLKSDPGKEIVISSARRDGFLAWMSGNV